MQIQYDYPLNQLNVLSRLSKFLSQECKLLIYKSFIRSNFNYCPVVWHFCSKTDTEKLEKLQHRALRITFNDYNASYTELLQKANTTTLYNSRTRTIAQEAFKCLHKQNPTYLHDIITFRQDKYSFRYTNTAKVPTVRTTTYGKNSFRFSATQVWNSLPTHIRNTDNYKEFVGLIRTWDGGTCRCAACK